MENLNKIEELNELFSVYLKLLTDKQVQYFKMYYYLDYSLQEIADNYGVSRNAIHDQLKKTEEHLYNYEEKLELVKYRNKRLELINEFFESEDITYLKELRKLDE